MNPEHAVYSPPPRHEQAVVVPTDASFVITSSALMPAGAGE